MVVFVVIYHALGGMLFWKWQDHDQFDGLLLGVLGYFTLIVLLALRFSARFREWVVREPRNNAAFLKRLRIPIVIWSVLPTSVVLIYHWAQ